MSHQHTNTDTVTVSGSDEACYITGTTIYADGGRLALNYTVDVADKG